MSVTTWISCSAELLLMSSIVTEALSMLKAVICWAALIKTVPISVALGTEDELKATSIVLMIDPLLRTEKR